MRSLHAQLCLILYGYWWISVMCFRVKTYSLNDARRSWRSFSARGAASLSAVFTPDSRVYIISVQARIQNQLGFAVSPVINYTLSDISKTVPERSRLCWRHSHAYVVPFVLMWTVMPPAPVLYQVVCSSRNCTVKVEQLGKTQHLDISYKPSEQETWTSSPDSVSVHGVQGEFRSSVKGYSLISWHLEAGYCESLWTPWAAVDSKPKADMSRVALLCTSELSVQSKIKISLKSKYLAWNIVTVNKNIFSRLERNL